MAPYVSIANRVIAVGQQLSVTNTASDLDSPGQSLSFSLDPGSPEGMTLTPESGILRWVPIDAQGNSTNWVIVRVTDDGCGNLSSAQSFSVAVVERPLLQAFLSTNAQPVLLLGGQDGVIYGIEATTNLGNPNSWQPIWQGTLTNLSQLIEPSASTNRMMFFRALRR